MGVDLSSGIRTSHVAFDREPIEITPEQALRAAGDGESDRSKLQDAEQFLRSELKDGPRPVNHIKAAAKEVGVAS